MPYITFFFTITLIIYLLFNLGSERKDRIKRRLDFIQDKESVQEEEKEEKDSSLFKRIISPLWKEFKKSFKRKMPGEKEAQIEIKLLQAGSPMGMTPVDFRLLQLSLMVALPVGMALYTWVLGVGLGQMIMFVLGTIIVAAILPHYYLKLKIKNRSQQALRELPDVIDLLTVSLEAGLGFDSALSKLISKKQGVLTSEFHRALEEIRLGKTRREALAGIKDRLLVDEIKLLISSIIQAEKLGIGMVQVLRVQSYEVREQRKQRAEEAAMKAPIKMLFPLVIFIFPCLFIVLLGPAVIQFIETFN